jgi:hypothetical protein
MPVGRELTRTICSAMASSSVVSSQPLVIERAREKLIFRQPHWGVLGDSAWRDLFAQTGALNRFLIFRWSSTFLY